MITIRTLTDIEKLSHRKSIHKYLKDYFFQLRENLIENEKEEEFSLESYGYIIILEPEDDVRNLESVGLNSADGGLLGSCPEFVNLIYLDDISLYQIGVLYDNEYMMIFYSKVGQFDEEVETFLSEYAETSN